MRATFEADFVVRLPTDEVNLQLAGDLIQGRSPHLHADESLDYAMRRIAESGLKALPVVSRDNERELKGTVSVADGASSTGPAG